MSSIIQTMLKEITKNNTKKCSLKELDTLLFSMLSDYYKEEPVPVEDFLFDEYYLGQATKTLFPIWRKNLLSLYQSKFISPNYLVILEAAIGCIDKNQLIHTDKGLFPIKDLYLKSQLGESFKIQTEKKEEKILEVFHNGIQKLNIIETHDGKELCITDKHRLKVFTENGIEWKSGKDLEIGDLLVQQRKQTNNRKSDNQENLCYLIGMLLGDGYVPKLYDTNNMKENLIEITLRKQIVKDYPDYINYLKSLFKECIKKEPKLKLDRDKVFRLYTYDKDFIEFLQKENFTDGQNKQICNFILKASVSEQLSFLAGLIDSDGSIDSKSCEISSKLIDVLKTLQNILSSLGVATKISKKFSKQWNKYYYRLFIRQEELKSLYNLGLDLKLPYKKEKVEDIVNRPHHFNNRDCMIPLTEKLKEEIRSCRCIDKNFDKEQKKHVFSCLWNKNKAITLFSLKILYEKFTKELKNSLIEYIVTNNIWLDEIVDIGIDKRDTYDLSVENEHSYLINGIVSHNSGKSLVLGLIACIELGRLLCLKNPASFYGLAPQDILYFVFYTFKRKVAEDGNWQQFLNLLSISPYFREHINPPATPYAGQLTPNIACRVASLSGDLVSKAVIFAGMDEFNEKKNRLTSNTKIYNEMLRRMDSRFMNTTVQPYKLVVCSSPKDESDELGKVIDDIKKYKTKGCKIIDGITAMDTSGLRVNYSGDNFKVYVDPSNSYIMENDNDIRTTEFDGGNVYEVPIEYKRSFEFDIIGAIREILGIRIGSIGKFFRDPKLIDTAFTKKNLTPDTLILPFNIGYEEGVNLLYNKISKDYTFKQAPRCIHIDTALNGDRLGLGASFVVPIQDYAIINTTKDEVFQNAMIINDFSIGVETADGQEIPLDVIVGTLNKLYTEGYPIHIISWDSYQSASIRQPLNRLNMENEYNSMDITKEPYLILKRAILSGRFLGANNYLAKEEAKGLVNVPEKNKIDHPTDGSKDIIDGVTGSVYSCYVYLNELLRKFNRHENQKVNYKKQLQRAGFKPIG